MSKSKSKWLQRVRMMFGGGMVIALVAFILAGRISLVHVVGLWACMWGAALVGRAIGHELPGTLASVTRVPKAAIYLVALFGTLVVLLIWMHLVETEWGMLVGGPYAVWLYLTYVRDSTRGLVWTQRRRAYVRTAIGGDVPSSCGVLVGMAMALLAAIVYTVL